jgi:prepilin-type N-terminal cleavage/methylation domain-containing protein
MRRGTRHLGFTLLELLLTIALTGVVTTLAMSAFISMTDQWRIVRSRADLDREADHAFSLIRSDLGSLVSPSLAAVPLEGVHRMYRESDAVIASAERGDDEVTLSTYGETPSGGRVAGLVAYQVTHDGDRHTLKRIPLNASGQSGDAPGTPVMGDGVDVLWFDLKYAAADGAWRDSWAEASPPVAVRVEMTLRAEDSQEQVIRQATLPIHVS